METYAAHMSWKLENYDENYRGSVDVVRKGRIPHFTSLHFALLCQVGVAVDERKQLMLLTTVY